MEKAKKHKIDQLRGPNQQHYEQRDIKEKEANLELTAFTETRTRTSSFEQTRVKRRGGQSATTLTFQSQSD